MATYQGTCLPYLLADHAYLLSNPLPHLSLQFTVIGNGRGMLKLTTLSFTQEQIAAGGW